MSSYTPDFYADFGQHFTLREVAKLMKCSHDHVIALYNQGELEGINIAKKGATQRELRFSEEALDLFAQRRAGPKPSNEPEPKGKPVNAVETAGVNEDYNSWFDE